MLFFIFSFIINFYFFKKFLKSLNILNLKYLNLQNKNTVQSLHAASDFIDIIVLYLEAGSNIYHAFGQATNCTINHNIKKNAQIALSRYLIGCSLIESLHHSMGQKNNQYYDEIIENISLSLQLGTSLKANLSELSTNMRLRAHFKLEEIVAKAPVKMIFPLVFFIFPVIFILLGSGTIQDLIISLRF